MALLAEQIVQEWLTRNGYFTMRGLKIGNDEIDLLATKHLGNGNWHHQHIEVQVSLRPVSYISGLTKERQKEFNISSRKSATKRSIDQLNLAVKDWITLKFNSPKKKNFRFNVSNSDNWEFVFVHGKMKFEQELQIIKEHGINTIPIHEILNDLLKPKPAFTTYAATDIIELLGLVK